MNLERLRDVSGIVQNVLISVAVIIGGIWTIFLFLAQRPDIQAERDQFAQAILNVVVEARQLDLEDEKDGPYFLAATATITNNGKRTGVIDVKETPPFKISPIEFTDGQAAKLGKPILARNVTRTPLSALGGGAVDQFHLFLRLPGPGHYYVEFVAPLSELDFKIDKQIPREAMSWWGATSVKIEKREPKVGQRN